VRAEDEEISGQIDVEYFKQAHKNQINNLQFVKYIQITSPLRSRFVNRWIIPHAFLHQLFL
jgi:hypothetical protein